MKSRITTEQVKELRDSTGISVMQCRKALEEAEGDRQKALAILKKTSADIALKKMDREVKDGRVCVRANSKRAVMVALHCETDFVSKNEDFVNLLEKICEKTLNEGAQKTRDGAREMIDPVIQRTGENIQLGDIHELEGEVLGHYVHNNKSAVIVSLKGGDAELAKDIAMHITAMKPEYIFETNITEEASNTVREIFQKEVAAIDKPEEIKEKMLQGKMNTYFKEKTLLDQPFIKNAEETVGELLSRNKADIIEVKCSFI